MEGIYMSKVLIVLTNAKNFKRTESSPQPTTGSEWATRKIGFDIKELAYIYELIRKRCSNAQFVFVTPNGGEAPIDEESMRRFEHDEIVRTFMNNRELMKMLKETKKVDEINPEEFKCVLFPGGPGAVVDLPYAHSIEKVICKVFDNRGLVGAIGHGAAGFVNLKNQKGEFWVKNKKLTCATKEEDHELKLDRELPFILEDVLRERGAKIERGKKFEAHVVYDREHQLLTAQNPQSAKEWIMKLLEIASRGGRDV